MSTSILLIQQILSMFLSLIVGYIIVKADILEVQDAGPISTVVLYVICPCTIINAFLVEFSPDRLRGFLLATALATIATLLFILISYLLKKPLKLDAIEMGSISYPNAGNLILPIVTSVLGPEFVIYACPYVMVQTFFMWTHLNSMIKGETHLNLKKILTNINILALFFGLFLFITRLKLPAVLTSFISSMGGCIGPLSMLIIGMAIGKADLKTIFLRPRNYLICSLRLLLMPLLFILFIKITGIAYLFPEAYQICMIVLFAAGSSAASTVSQMATAYGKDAFEASMINVMSVLLLIVTLPLMIMIYHALI